MTEDGEVWLCSEEHPGQSGWHCDLPHGHDGDHKAWYALTHPVSWPRLDTTKTIPLCGSTTPVGAQVIACYTSPGHGGPRRGNAGAGAPGSVEPGGPRCDKPAGHEGHHTAGVGDAVVVWDDSPPAEGGPCLSRAPKWAGKWACEKEKGHDRMHAAFLDGQEWTDADDRRHPGPCLWADDADLLTADEQEAIRLLGKVANLLARSIIADDRLSVAAVNYTSAMLRFNQVMSLTRDQMATFVHTLRGAPGTSVIVDEEEESGPTLTEAKATEPRSYTFTEQAPWEPPPVWYKPATTLQRLKAGVPIVPPIRARIIIGNDPTPNRTERRHGTKGAIVPPSGS